MSIGVWDCHDTGKRPSSRLKSMGHSHIRAFTKLPTVAFSDVLVEHLQVLSEEMETITTGNNPVLSLTTLKASGASRILRFQRTTPVSMMQKVIRERITVLEKQWCVTCFTGVIVRSSGQRTHSIVLLFYKMFFFLLSMEYWREIKFWTNVALIVGGFEFWPEFSCFLFRSCGSA
jgi:hypothetical protein